jgi:quercetin dioxygenase-like cupin family protein
MVPPKKGKGVNLPSGGTSPPHHHAGSAFIYAYVLSGAVRGQVDDEPVRTYKAGEDFYEMPGARHRFSENANAQNPATMLAVYVVVSKDKPLTTPDQK